MTVAHATPDPADIIVDWLAHLYDHIDEGWLTLFSQNRVTGRRYTDWSPVDNYDTFTQTALTRAVDSCVWWGVATRHTRLDHGRGTAADCAHIPALWADIDIAGPNHQTAHPLPPSIDDAVQLLDDFPLPPTAVIHTGGGLQPWWLLNEPRTTQELQHILDAWAHTWTQTAARRGWHLDNVFDAARVMRLPGTWNRKTTPTPVEIVHTNWDLTYGLDDLEQHLQDPPAAPPAATTPKVPYIGPARPGDAYNATNTGNDVLNAAGWTHHHTDRNGDQHWTRPGKPPRDGASATVYADDGHTTIWTDAIPGLDARRPYDPFGLYTAIHHRGDFTTATNTLSTQGYGTPPPSNGNDLEWIGDTPPDTPTTPQLDHETFWTARPELEHIRTYAHAQMSSPWAVLGGVLARITCQAPTAIVLPPIIEDLASINLAIALVGRSGDGKGGATGTARRAVNIGSPRFDTHTLGSGQGIAHGYGHWQNGKDGEPGHVERHADSVLFIVEEVDHLGAHAAQNASTTLAELRRFVMGEKLGHLYVDRTRRVEIPEHTYRGAFLVGVQPARAGALLGDADGGTPQRFVWLPVLDPNPPDKEPDTPQPYTWRHPDLHELPDPDSRYDGRRPIPVCDTAVNAIRTERRRRARGEGDPLDGHRLLCRERVAAALGLLNGHYGITEDDWALSEHVMAVSDATRDAVAKRLQADKRAANRSRAHEEEEREETKDDLQLQRVAQRLLARLRRTTDWVTEGELRRHITSRDRNVLEAALEGLVAVGEVESEPFTGPGSESVRYRATSR